MVKLIVQDYKIVKKESTKVLLETLYQCKALYKAYDCISLKYKEEARINFNNEIDEKLRKCFNYYHKHYGVEIENGYGEMKDIEINLSNICEKIKSWEEDETTKDVRLYYE